MNNRTQSLVLNEDLEPWLRDHGFELRQTRHATIQLGAWSTGVRVWMDVEFIKLDENGKPFLDPDSAINGTPSIAIGTASVPLKSWPPLTHAEPPAEDDELP